MEIIAGLIIVVVWLVLLTIFVWSLSRHKKEINRLNLELTREKQRYQDLFRQKKSSEVKLGGITEQLAPFLQDFPCDTSDIHFIGQPIDYICFDNNGVHFVEVKSGDAKLSPKQRIIKEQVLKGQVHWHIMRVKKNGKSN